MVMPTALDQGGEAESTHEVVDAPTGGASPSENSEGHRLPAFWNLRSEYERDRSTELRRTGSRAVPGTEQPR